MKKPVILSGMRPSGRLHLGNYLGALKNWIQLQQDYQCYYCIVDWHALTTGYQETDNLNDHIREMLIDWLSAGLDPAQSVIFRQSAVLEHAELFLLLAMITPISWLERCPTFKEQLKQMEGKEINTYGFLGYPLLQAADIMAYRAEAVPVGEDQAPHIELTREVVRRFNYLFGEIFPEPATLLGSHAMVQGADGRKMSKSYDNYIAISSAPREVRGQVSQMITDPQRARRSDPGRPEVCTVYGLQQAFNQESLEEINEGCRRAGIGCVQCKELLAAKLLELIEPIHEKREQLRHNQRYLEEVLDDGNRKARAAARATLEIVRRAMHI